MTEHGSVCTTESFFPRAQAPRGLTPRGAGGITLKFNGHNPFPPERFHRTASRIDYEV